MVQLFVPDVGSPSIVGVIGALQLDVLKARLDAEYSLPVEFEAARFSICRWISSKNKAAFETFLDKHRSSTAKDLDGDPVFLAENGFSLNYEAERAPDMVFETIKDYQVSKAG